MEQKSFACIGNITKDTIITPNSQKDLPGGSVWYISKAIASLGPCRYEAVCGVGEAEQGRVGELREAGINARAIVSRESVCFENRYLDIQQSQRVQRAFGCGGSFMTEDLEGIHADVIHLGSLMKEDFPLETIRALSERAVLSADAQGFLRTVIDSKVYPSDWEGKLEALKCIRILKANRDEMLTITGEQDPHEAALKLASWGVREVLLTFDVEGSLIYSQGTFTEIPAYPCLEVVDSTGCGDTYMAGYLYKRAQGASIFDAGCFAAAMCTLKLQAHGPFSATEKNVEEIIQTRSLLPGISF